MINDLYGYEKDYSYLNDVIKKTLELNNAEDAIFSIIFVDDLKIHELNREYRGIDKVTDVISFAFEDNEESHDDERRVLGDIYISIPRMIYQAEEYCHSEKRELSFLVVHGLLHLLGYDHMIKEEEEVMFKMQDDILDSLDIRK